MKALSVVVLLLGIAVIALGVVISVQLADVQEQLEMAESASGLEAFEATFQALGAFLNWVGNSFGLLIVNLFLTGAALVFSGLAFTRATVQRKVVASREVSPTKENADDYCERGDFYYETDEYDKAIANYNRAIELDPNDVDAYYNRGCAYGEIGEYDKAIADYNKVIELNPNDAGAYYNRGCAYHEKGELPKAVSDLEKCLELSTDPELTKDAQQELYKIKNSPEAT